MENKNPKNFTGLWIFLAGLGGAVIAILMDWTTFNGECGFLMPISCDFKEHFIGPSMLIEPVIGFFSGIFLFLVIIALIGKIKK